MKQIILWLSLVFITPAFAQESLEPLLNKITLELKSIQWVTTKTALVNVSVNASIADQGIDQMQNNILQKLNQLAKSEWHILSFNRQQDKSGLESIHVLAQARLMQTELNNLRDKAKNISKPGETFTIDSVQFIPSDEELQQANINLRNDIYKQAKMEIDLVNTVYTDQKYYLHQIDFISAPVVPLAMNAMYRTVSAEVAASAPQPQQPSLSVGNKQELHATVILAATPGSSSPKSSVQ